MDAIFVLRTCAFFRRALWSACFVLLFPLALLSSSSEADDIAPWRSVLDLDRFWSGALGCADAGDDGEAVKSALAGGSVPDGVQRDYLDCGARALRAEASRMLVDTIEDSLRWGGLHAFDREFRLDSSLTWEFGGDIRGELDTILPIGGVLRDDGTGHALFLQQGITFWEGRDNKLRSDSNTGLVYRGHASQDWVLGGSLFYDYNFQREHSRLSVGVDAQNNNFYGGLNYYFTPSGREWRRGRAGYEERVLEGWDLRWSFAWERLRVGGAFGTWVFDGEGPGRRQSASISAGYRVYPGVFLEAGYEYHDDRSVDEEWNLGLAFRYSLPEMEGIGGNGTGSTRAPDLWRIVDRERRILYEERSSHGRASAALKAADTRVEEGESVAVQVVLSEAVEADVSFSLVADSSSTADTDDYTLPSSITVPAGALSTEAMVDIVDDNEEESDEILDLELRVARESSLLVVRGDSHRMRVMIAASDNSVVGFATESTSVHEGVEVHIPLALGEPAPAGGLVLLTSSENEEDVATDGEMEISPGAQDGQYVRVVVSANNVVEDAKTARLVLSAPPGGLPEGWRIGRSEHMLMISPNNQTAMFVENSGTVNENNGSASFKVGLSADAPEGGVPLEVAITSGNEDGDVTFATQSFAIAEGNSEHTLSVDINDDDLVEPDEVVTFTLSKGSGVTFPNGWGDLGAPTTYDLTILDNDSANIGFASNESVLLEGGTTATLTVLLTGLVSQDVEVTISESGDSNNDLTFSPAALTFAPGEASKEVTLTVNAANDDNTPEGDVEIAYTLAGTLPDGVRFVAREHIVTFVDDDRTVRFENPSSSVSEGTLGHPVAVVLNFDPPADGLEVAAVARGDHAGDVLIPSPGLRFTGSTRELSVLVDVLNDIEQEGAEIVLLELEEGSTPLPAGWTLLASGDNDHDLTILPSGQTAMFAEAGRTVSEGDGTVTFNVTLSADAPADGVPLEVAITSGNEDGDVIFTTQNFTIAEGEREHTISVDINNDDVLDSGETVMFELSEGADFPRGWGSLGTPKTFELTIMDNDSVTIGFTTTSSTLLEGDVDATLTVRLAGSVSQDVEVTLSESGDDNNDLTFSPSTLTFAPGETDKQVTLTVNAANDDAAPEEDVEITYELGGLLPLGVLLDPQGHVVTFVDDDKTVSFKEPSSNAVEGSIGHPVAVVLNFDPPADGLEVAAVARGVHAGDVSISSPELRFTGSTRELSVLVDVLNDIEQEGAEIVYLELEEAATPLPAGWTLVASGSNDHDLTIESNDQTAMFTEAGRTANEGDGTVSFQVALSANAPEGGVPLEVAITSGNEDGDVTFTTQNFTIIEGERQHTLTVDINDDGLVELDEVVIFTLSKDANAVFPDAWGNLGAPTTYELTIRDNDSANIGFASNESVLLEGGTTATLTVSLAKSVSQDVEVTISESGDSNNDLTFSPSALAFAPGETSKAVTLTVNAANDDAVPEGDVEITYTLAGTLPDGVRFATREHVVTFVDDDRTVRFENPSSIVSEGTLGHPVAVVLNFDPPADGLEVAAVARGDHAGDVLIPSPGLRFTGSTRELSVLVDVLNDIEQEGAEIVLLELEEGSTPLPAGWTLLASGDNDHDLTILPSGQTAMFAEAGRTVSEGDGTVTFNVALSADAPADGVPLEVAITSGNEDGDVTFTTQNFTIAEGEREHTLSVDISDDNLLESDEVVTFTLSKDASKVFPDAWGGLGTQTTFDLLIRVNDKVIGFADTLPAELEEGTSGFPLEVVWNAATEGSFTMVVTLEKGDDGDTSEDVYIYGTDAGTLDENTVSGRLSYEGPAGSDGGLTLDVRDDALAEEVEEVVVRLAPDSPLPAGWTVEPAEYRFTIPANDKIVGFGAESSSLVENAEDSRGEVSEDVVLKLNAPAPVGGLNLVVSVNEETDDDGDNIDVDVTTGAGGIVFISEGAEEVLLPVTALDDDIPEGDEPVVLTLSKGANWPEGWEIGNSTGGSFFETGTVTILGNDKRVGWQQAIRKLVSEANFASVSPVVTNYPAPAGGLHFTVEVIPHGGSYAPADVSTDPDSGDLFYREEVSVRENTRFQGVNTVAPRDDGEAEPDEAAVFRLSVKNGEQLPPGWEWSNQDLEVVIFANDNDFTFTDQNGETEGSYSEGDTVRLTAVMDNPLPPPVSDDQNATFDLRVGRFGMEITEHSDDISIAPVAPVVYHSDYHNPDGSRKPGVVAPIDGGQERFAEYNFDVTEDGLRSVSFDVTINEDSETEPPESIVITLSMSGNWGKRPTTHQYTLTINDEGGTGMVGFREGEMPYGVYERAFGEQRPGLLVELSSPAPAGGIKLVMAPAPGDEHELWVDPVNEDGWNFEIPEYREQGYFRGFGARTDGTQEPDEIHEIIISEAPNDPLPQTWEIVSGRSSREIEVYSSDNKVGIAGFVDPADNMIKENISLDESALTARLVLFLTNDPGPGFPYDPANPPGLHLRLDVVPDPDTAGADFDDIGNFFSQDFIVPRRNQEGSFQHVIEIPITDDMYTERPENFSFNLSHSGQYGAGSLNRWGSIDGNNNSATLTILQDDSSTVGFSPAEDGEPVPEGGSHSAMIELSSPVPVPVSVNVTVEESDGDDAADVSLSQGILTLPANVPGMPFFLTVVDDDLTEGEEEITLRLSAGENFPGDLVSIAQETHTFTVLGSDNIVEFTGPSAQVSEDVGTFNFSVTLSNPAPAGGLPLSLFILERDRYYNEDDITLAELNTPFVITPEDGLEYTFSITITQNDGPEGIETNFMFLEPLEGFPSDWGEVDTDNAYRIFILANET